MSGIQYFDVDGRGVMHGPSLAAYDLVWSTACARTSTGIVDAVSVQHLNLKAGDCLDLRDRAGLPRVIVLTRCAFSDRVIVVQWLSPHGGRGRHSAQAATVWAVAEPLSACLTATSTRIPRRGRTQQLEAELYAPGLEPIIYPIAPWLLTSRHINNEGITFAHHPHTELHFVCHLQPTT